MNDEQARLTFTAACAIGRDCLEFLNSIQQTENCYQFLNWRDRVVAALGTVYFEMLGPLFAEHPELQEEFRLPAFPHGYVQMKSAAADRPDILSREVADEAVLLCRAIGKLGNDLLWSLKENTAEKEFILWRGRVAQVLGDTLEELVRPIFDVYPEYEAKLFGQDSAVDEEELGH